VNHALRLELRGTQVNVFVNGQFAICHAGRPQPAARRGGIIFGAAGTRITPSTTTLRRPVRARLPAERTAESPSGCSHGGVD
jgi:hypothetical protein